MGNIIFYILIMACCCGSKKEINSELDHEENVYEKKIEKNTLEEEKISMEEESFTKNKKQKKSPKKSPKKSKQVIELKSEEKKLMFAENVVDHHGEETKAVNQSNVTINESMVQGDYHELVEIDNKKAKKIKANMKNKKKNKCFFCCKVKDIDEELDNEVNLENNQNEIYDDDIIKPVKED